MTRRTAKWASVVLSAFAPPSEVGLSPLPGEVDYAGAFRRLVRGSTALAACGLVAAVWLVALAPVWMLGRMMTFAQLDPSQRAVLLGQLLRHRVFAVRELTLLLKLGAALALLGAPSVRARSGYDNVQLRATTESGLRRKLPLQTPEKRDESAVS